MENNKQVGALARHYTKDPCGNIIWGDFDVDFGGGRTLGKLEIGREFEILYGGIWVKTSLGYSETKDAYYLDKIGFINALGMTVRI